MEQYSLDEQIEHKFLYLLSCVDRDPLSKTFGCFDRMFWGWKLKDFPDLTLQRLLFPLTKILIEKSELDEEYLTLINAGINFIKLYMHTDGAIDQAFFGEHSHAGTGFLLFDLIQLFFLIEKQISECQRKTFLEVIRAMSDYLVRFDERHSIISNHLLGGAAALIFASEILREEKYKKKGEQYLNFVLSNQTKAGSFIEYEGADPGYQTLAIYYLSYIYKKLPKKKIKRALENAVDFISYFIHPDGSFGGEYGSRNVEIFFIGGIVLLANEFELARNIINFMIKSIEKGKTVILSCVDDGNLAPLFNSYLLLKEYCKIHEERDVENAELLPFKRNFVKVFTDEGIIVVSRSDYYAVLNVFKGGVLKVFDKNNKCLKKSICGIICKQGNKAYTTQYMKKRNFSFNGKKVEFNVKLSELHQPIPSTLKFIVLKAYYLIFHKSYLLRELFKKILVGLLIKKKNITSISVDIRITFKESEVVFDCLCRENIEFKIMDNFKTIHMASSKYFFKQKKC